MDLRIDEALIGRLPLPLARLYRLASRARTPLEQHACAVYLWEAALKLLASLTVIEYLARGEPDPGVQERLAHLARPSLGRWLEFILRLVPLLAERDPPFASVQGFLRGGPQWPLPRGQALMAAFGEEKERPTSRVGLARLFDELVAYRNRELGHGATGHRPNEFYLTMGRALLEAAAETLGQLDVLVGRRLVYLVSRGGGREGMDRFELVGEVPVPLGPLELSGEETGDPPHPNQLYVVAADSSGAARFFCLRGWLPLAPLVHYDPETGEVFFFHRSRGSHPAEYLSFTTGRYTSFPYREGTSLPVLVELLQLQTPDVSTAPPEHDLANELHVFARTDTGVPSVEGLAAGEPATGAGFAAPGEPAPCARGPSLLSRLGEYEVRGSLCCGAMGTLFRVGNRCWSARSPSRYSPRIRRKMGPHASGSSGSFASWVV
jgi:hypothetical protein